MIKAVPICGFQKSEIKSGSFVNVMENKIELLKFYKFWTISSKNVFYIKKASKKGVIFLIEALK